MKRNILNSSQSKPPVDQGEREAKTDAAIDAIRQKSKAPQPEINININQDKPDDAPSKGPWVGAAIAVGAGVAEVLRRLFTE